MSEKPYEISLHYDFRTPKKSFESKRFMSMLTGRGLEFSCRQVEMDVAPVQLFIKAPGERHFSVYCIAYLRNNDSRECFDNQLKRIDEARKQAELKPEESKIGV